MRNRILICSLIAVLVGLMMGAAVAEEKVNGDDGDIVVVVNGSPSRLLSSMQRWKSRLAHKSCRT